MTLVNMETQPLAQNKSATFTSQTTKISPQKISKNTPYATITKLNSNQTGERISQVTTTENSEKIPIKQKPTEVLVQIKREKKGKKNPKNHLDKVQRTIAQKEV